MTRNMKFLAAAILTAALATTVAVALARTMHARSTTARSGGAVGGSRGSITPATRRGFIACPAGIAVNCNKLDWLPE
jgi:uncharacterized membrane protein